MTITVARVDEIMSALATAGPDWPAVAKKLPEYKSLSLGVPAGLGCHRPHVWLNEDIEGRRLLPPRIVQYDDGRWFLLGQRIHEERTQTWQPMQLPSFGSSTPSGSSGGATT